MTRYYAYEDQGSIQISERYHALDWTERPKTDYRVMVYGDLGCGKTQLLQRLLGREFSDRYKSTITIDVIGPSAFSSGQKDIINLTAWDVAGTTICDSIRPTISNNAAIVVIDLSNEQGLKNLNTWLQKVKNHHNKGKQVILVGSKADQKLLETDAVREQIERWNNRPGNEGCQISSYIETSARDNVQIDAVFEEICQHAQSLKAKNAHEATALLSSSQRNSYATDSRSRASSSTATSRYASFPATPKSPRIISSEMSTIRERLLAYIERIEGYRADPDEPLGEDNPINFAHGFMFFGGSRAQNREANYLLAKKLVDDIWSGGDALQATLGRLDAVRAGLCDIETNRGINSTELNDIIATMRR